MKKISQKDLEKLKGRGATVKVTKKKTTPAKTNDVPMASMSAAIERIATENKKTIKAFAEEVKQITGRKRKPWLFTVNRNDQGTITTVLADPVE